MAISTPVLAIQINEIMYDPQYNENYNEWIELYNEDDESIDLTNATICDKSLGEGYIDRSGAVHNGQGFILAPGAYALITDGGSGSEVYDNYDVASSTLALHIDASSICGGLANEGDTIVISKGNETIDEVLYTGDAEPGFSLEFRGGAFLPSAEIDGTPGRENSVGGSQNETNNEPPQNETIDPPERDEEEEPPREQAPRVSFVPLESSGKRSESQASERNTIRLGSPRITTRESAIDEYLTPEGRTRQTVIYAFAGFCIVLTLLIVLKKV